MGRMVEIETPVVTCRKESCVYHNREEESCEYVLENELELDEGGRCLNYELSMWKKELYGYKDEEDDE